MCGRYLFNILVGCSVLVAATACNGILGGIYDEPQPMTVNKGQLFIDATNWKNWYYIDFDSLQQIAASGDEDRLRKAQTEFTPYPIPTGLSVGAETTGAGLYTYWFDVLGKGISVNEKRSFTPTDAQPEPPSWSIAVHRNNVRTNGTVLETNYTSMDDLPENSTSFTGATFQADEWSENEVWADQSQMLLELIPCQGIKVSKALSSWLRIDIPPMPPAFTLNNHVFIVRLSNGKCAAVQLENYMNSQGTKCWLTINYKYPY